MSAQPGNRERLQKVLARAGIASRRDSEKLILAGRVTVNGEVVQRMGTQVDPETDEIRVDTELLRPSRNPITLLLVKPRGYICTTRDEQGRRTILNLLPTSDRRLYPVGRLDEDSAGLLLVSDDGTLTNLVTHPRYGIPKTYELTIRGRIDGAEVKRVESGVWLSDGKTGPARIRIKKRGRDTSRLEVTLNEGRNRELRRIFAKLGHPVLHLRRTKIGNLTGKGLKPGQWRKLNRKDIAGLKAMARSQ